MAKFQIQTDAVDVQVDDLCENFGGYLARFNAAPPFKKTDVFDEHIKTVKMRKDLGGSAKSIDSDEYIRSLYKTLEAWGMNKGKNSTKGAKMQKYPTFAASIREYKPDIVALEGMGAAQLDSDAIRGELWRIIQGMKLSARTAQTVTGAKALHHLLPQLLPPIDWTYTKRFFRYYNSQFHNNKNAFNRMTWYFAQIAQRVDLGRYVGAEPWATSESKLIDNAIVGYYVLHPELKKYKN